MALQEELVQQRFVKPAPDAALAAKGAAKARKAKRKSASTEPDFREFQSPGGFQVLSPKHEATVPFHRFVIFD